MRDRLRKRLRGRRRVGLKSESVLDCALVGML